MKWLWRLIAMLGAVPALLGGLWLAQGIGLVTIDPILCAGDCVPVDAPSVRWAVTGAITALIGIGLVAVGICRSQRRLIGEGA